MTVSSTVGTFWDLVAKSGLVDRDQLAAYREELEGTGDGPECPGDRRGQPPVTMRRIAVTGVGVICALGRNTAEYAESLPITLRFSRLVGTVLREVPADQEPASKYSYYM